MASTIKEATKTSKAILRAPSTTGKLSTTTNEQTSTNASTISLTKDQSPLILILFTLSRDLTRTPLLSADALIAKTFATLLQEKLNPSNYIYSNIALNSATESTNQNSLIIAENLMLEAIQKLQTIYNNACKTENIEQIVIE